MNPRVALLINAGCALVLGWLYGGDALDALRAQSAEVSAYLEPPSLVFALGSLLATGVGFAAGVVGIVQKRDRAWRGYRLMPIVTVVVLFVDLFLFNAAKSPLNAAERTTLTIAGLAEAASRASSSTTVPTSPRELEAMATQFGSPPYLVNGEPVKAWSVVVRQGCTGPVTEVKGEPVGTLFYCLSADASQAWVSAVGLPMGTYFGVPSLFTHKGEPVVGVVNAEPTEEPLDVDEPHPLDLEGPARGLEGIETADSGR